jgi:hypothetical protein
MAAIRRTAVLGLGCAALFVLGGAPRAQAPSAGVTFNKDVAPILNKNCVSCHRPGEIAPMSLMSYADARPWARAIKRAAVQRTMPPWGADPQFGEFLNDPHLSAQDVSTLVAWADSGAIQGEAKDLPPSPAFASGWTIGTPDSIVTMTGAFEVPAGGPRIIQDFPTDASFTEDTYVERMEVLPGVRSVTHHAIVNVVDATGTHRIGGFQPGGATTTYPQGIVRMIPKGSTIALNMHYNPKGHAELDRTRIAFVFAKGSAKQVAITSVSSTRDLDIPPGEWNYEAKGKPFVFSQNSHIVALLPRMNERGRDFKYTLVYPDGRSVVLLSVPKFDDEWQPSYILKTAIAAPKGSRIETVAHYDNSAANKRNPDPTARVPFGPEILNGYIDYTVDETGH